MVMMFNEIQIETGNVPWPLWNHQICLKSERCNLFYDVNEQLNEL